MHPVYRFLATINNFAPTVLRLVLTTVFFVHGTQKTFGWFGGPGWNAQLAKWTDPAGMNLPYSLAVVGIVAEVVGAAGMLLGFCTRLAALLLLGQMVVAIAVVHLPHGFLDSGGGFEYPMTLGGIALALLYCGGGRFSIDRALTRQLLPPNSGIVGAYKLPSNV